MPEGALAALQTAPQTLYTTSPLSYTLLVPSLTLLVPSLTRSSLSWKSLHRKFATMTSLL